MGDFFANMNFVRAMILISLLGAAILGWLFWSQGKALEQLERERALLGPRTVREVMELSHRYEQLDRQLSRDDMVQLDNPATYIRQVAGQQQVNIGQVDVAPSRQPIGGGVVDNVYKIDPSDRSRAYSRSQIANFLYRLEEKSLKAKVTNLKLTPLNRPKPEEYLDDRWSFSATITSREAEG